MRQLLINTVLGHIALRLRARLDIIRAAVSNVETIGCIANDSIGEFLVSRLVKSDTIFVDVGAHIGSIISEVLYWNNSIQIIAIEAIPDKVEP